MTMDMIRIQGVIKNYDWGGKEYLQSLFGKRDVKPQAEYWMGTHPSGEAVTEKGEPLSSVSGTLPFLFKVLSIASPLSLQCHPTKAQAEEGWKRETVLRESGKPYNYQDDNEKAEVLSALTPVTALCGFRKLEDIKASLSMSIPLSYGKYYSGLDSIKDIFLSSFSFGEDVKKEILGELSSTVTQSEIPSLEGEYLTEYGIVMETLGKYPGDIGSVFPLMMNVMHLRPFEAVYLEPDTLHAYIKGNGIELMTASDNVLRGGLTPKRVDIKELERIMYFGPTSASAIDEDEEGRVIWYLTPSPDFSLGYVNRSEAVVTLDKPSIILSLGSSVVNGVELKRGDCCFIRESDEPIQIKTSGTLYIATGKRD